MFSHHRSSSPPDTSEANLKKGDLEKQWRVTAVDFGETSVGILEKTELDIKNPTFWIIRGLKLCGGIICSGDLRRRVCKCRLHGRYNTAMVAYVFREACK